VPDADSRMELFYFLMKGFLGIRLANRGAAQNITLRKQKIP
jgi:hypothetical protein